LTSRRLFIGPIPEGWLKSHHKDWYKRHLGINFSSRRASFRASDNIAHERHVAGIDVPAIHLSQSFPQPEDAVEEDAARGAENEQGVVINTPPAEEAHHTSSLDNGMPRKVRPHTEAELEDSLKPPDIRVQEPTTDNTHSTAPEDDSAGTGVIVSINPQEHGHSRVSSNNTLSPNRASSVSSQYGVKGFTASEQAGPATSTSALIAQPEDDGPNSNVERRSESGPKDIISKVKRSIAKSPDGVKPTREEDIQDSSSMGKRKSQIHFILPGEGLRQQILLKARLTQLELQRAPSRILSLKKTLTDGQVIKTESMLVRVEKTLESKLPDDYDENTSQSVTTLTAEPFREYMIVCRQSSKNSGVDFILQMYRTRVIAAIDNSESRKHATHVVPLGRKISHVNLYSSLDKTVALWTPDKRGTTIFILRPRSMANSAEWYTFLRHILGWHRPSEIQVNVPEFNVGLRISNPFRELEALHDVEQEQETINEEELKRATDEEQLAARKIIDRCLEMLEASPELKDVLAMWSKGQRIGLAWKRYDRLEWIHGTNERKMYGTMAMMKSHELELRPKEHYPTWTKTRQEERMIEPPPVEGFLIRLTSQKGADQVMGRSFFKRLYYFVQDHYLIFSRPSKANPPAPPKIVATNVVSNINADPKNWKIPIIYSVLPYPVEDNKISWLKPGKSKGLQEKSRMDKNAYEETLRKVKNTHNCDGFIDLCSVVKIRNVQGLAPTDNDPEEDLDVEIGTADANTNGKRNHKDDRRTFEIVLNNDLVIRLQAFDEETKKEWMRRLRDLIRYWKHRHAADMELYRTVRRQNLEGLQIDEESEALIGQFARKWVVTNTYASPELYNMCGISCCRTIHLSGPLYHKPKRRSLFSAVHCILIPGHVLLFTTTLRNRSGRSIPHTHNNKINSINLTDCYLYSGLLTENDLLYQNQTFDSNSPGHNALPRIWVDDGWTSRDEDVMTCFVIWQPRSKRWFRQPESTGNDPGEEVKTKLKRVTNLGKKGRTIVFKARSRAERDHWVLAIGTEIERLQGGEDVRIVTVEKKQAGKRKSKQ
jgi:hypothetical protein